MSSSLDSKEKVQSSTWKDDIPHEVRQIVFPAFQVGAASGATGLLIGAFAGIIRSNTPVLFSLASGAQCSVLGFTITAFRGLVVHSWRNSRLTSNERISASSIAGALGGGVSGAILRGRSNVIPGAIMFALFGAVGQIIFNKIETRTLKTIPKVISDKEYEEMMHEKLLRLEAEIALVDDKIKAIQAQEQKDKSKNIGKSAV